VGSSKPKLPPEYLELRGDLLPKLMKLSPRSTPKPKKQFAESIFLPFASLLALLFSRKSAVPERL
jgi:hypothetical protein